MQPGRNDPCPCGSGKKYKKCCGVDAASTTVAPAALRDQALAAFQRGDFETSAARCRQWLRAAPAEFDAHHVLGLSELQSGRLSAAAAHLEKAVQLNPRNPFVLNNLAFARHGLGELAEAERCARAALAIDSQLADAHNNLGQTLLAAGRMQEAICAYREATISAPGNALFHSNLGGALFLQGELAEAEHNYRRALEMAPQFAPALAGLGAVCVAQKQWPEARTLLVKALAAGNQEATVFNNLGLALRGLNDPDAAQNAFRQALERKPDFGGAFFNLGMVFEDLGDLKSAATAYAQALQHGYQSNDAYLSLLQVAGNGTGGDLAYPHAMRLLSDSCLPEKILPALISTLAQACDFNARSQAWVHFDRLFSQGRIPEDVLFLSLLPSAYASSLSEETVLRYHRAWGDMVSRRLTALPLPANSGIPAPSGKIKLGYLSPDFREHSVGHFIRHVLGNHDRDAFEVICYSASSVRDEVTDFIRRQVDGFHDVKKLDDAALANKIRADGIHILVDLAGHTAGNRLHAMVLRPAPVQMTWIGYLHTTGLQAVDYRITDPFADDPEQDPGTERLLVLPESFLCFGAFPECEINTVPAVTRNGFVTFASFNNLAKLTAEALRVWAKLLARVPGSRLLIMATGAGSEVVRANLLAELGQHGIAPERIQLKDAVPRQDYLRVHNDVDLLLDTWPFNGGTVTAGALWMGVPVVTLAGKPHRQRVGYSLLKNIGVEDTIAWSEDDYVDVATRLAQDPARLARLRQDIATKVRGSILCDPPRFTRQLEAALRCAWDEYVLKNGPPAEAGH
jgi:predicted O-linked N-acetylglucosamine transferase (SPINDLY family)